MKRVELHLKRRVFNGFLKLDEAEVSFEQFDGQMSAPVKRLVLERGDGVAAIIYHRDKGKALLVNQFRYPTYEKGPGWLIETVAGMIDAEESPETAIIREIREEMGYDLESVEPIATFYVSPGGSTERIFLYFAEVSNQTPFTPAGGLESENEDIETVEKSLEELKNLLATQSIHDAKTIIAVQWLLNRQRENR